MIKENALYTKETLQAFNYGLLFKKVHRVNKFNKKALLKLDIDMNTELREKAKKDFEKYFFKLMNNRNFRKAIENVRKQGNITPEKKEEIIQCLNQTIILQSSSQKPCQLQKRRKRKYSLINPSLWYD